MVKTHSEIATSNCSLHVRNLFLIFKLVKIFKKKNDTERAEIKT
jgi:hypothetical protein